MSKIIVDHDLLEGVDRGKPDYYVFPPPVIFVSSDTYSNPKYDTNFGPGGEVHIIPGDVTIDDLYADMKNTAGKYPGLIYEGYDVGVNR